MIDLHVAHPNRGVPETGLCPPRVQISTPSCLQNSAQKKWATTILEVYPVAQQDDFPQWDVLLQYAGSAQLGLLTYAKKRARRTKRFPDMTIF